MLFKYPKFEKIDGETIIMEKPIHWKNYLGTGFLTVVSAVLLAAKLISPGTSVINNIAGEEILTSQAMGVITAIEVVFLAFATLYPATNLVKTATIRYYVTDRRIICVKGFLTITMREMRIDRCETVAIKQNVYERLFGCGDIVCYAPGSEIILNDVKDADKFKLRIMELLTAKRHGE